MRESEQSQFGDEQSVEIAASCHPRLAMTA